jgi:membrane-associated protease RseP (regulator of RpoE activity)
MNQTDQKGKRSSLGQSGKRPGRAPAGTRPVGWLCLALLAMALPAGTSQAAEPTVTHGWIGAWVTTGRPAHGSQPAITVGWTEAESPASTSLRDGDLLLRINNKPIESAASLRQQIEGSRPGSALDLLVRRGSKELNTRLTSVDTPPSDRRTIAAEGTFRGDRHHGTLSGYLDANRRLASGRMRGSGSGTIDGTFTGPWDLQTGAVRLAFLGHLHLLFTLKVEGLILGTVDRSGHGHGTFTAHGSVGSERGAWEAGPTTLPGQLEV